MEIPKSIMHKDKQFIYLEHSTGWTYSIFGSGDDRILVDAQTGNVFHEYQFKKPETATSIQQS